MSVSNEMLRVHGMPIAVPVFVWRDDKTVDIEADHQPQKVVDCLKRFAEENPVLLRDGFLRGFKVRVTTNVIRKLL